MERFKKIAKYVLSIVLAVVLFASGFGAILFALNIYGCSREAEATGREFGAVLTKHWTFLTLS